MRRCPFNLLVCFFPWQWTKAGELGGRQLGEQVCQPNGKKTRKGTLAGWENHSLCVEPVRVGVMVSFLFYYFLFLVFGPLAWARWPDIYG